MTDEQTANPFHDTIKVALYGIFGSQKTRQIGHLIDMVGATRVYTISADRGLGTIRSKIDPTMVKPVAGLQDLRDAWAIVSEKYNSPEYWVCIDGGSRVMAHINNEQFNGADAVFEKLAMGHQVPEHLKPFGRFITDRGRIEAMQVYGKIGRISETLLNSWISLNCNLLFTYLEDMTESDGRKKLPPYGPDVPGKVGLRAVMSSFDYVLRLGYDAESRLVATTRSSGDTMARTREDRDAGVDIPAQITNFNLAEFVQMITTQPTTQTEVCK